jgi:hypothetical protein
MNFDNLQPQSLPFTWEGKAYLLKEATEADVVTYEDSRESCFQRDESGNVIRFVGSLASTELLLLGRCVFWADSGQLVGEEIISKWPSRICRPLIQQLKDMSGLGPDTVEVIDKQIERLQKRRKDLLLPLAGNGSLTSGQQGTSQASSVSSPSPVP